MMNCTPPPKRGEQNNKNIHGHLKTSKRHYYLTTLKILKEIYWAEWHNPQTLSTCENKNMDRCLKDLYIEFKFYT